MASFQSIAPYPLSELVRYLTGVPVPESGSQFPTYLRSDLESNSLTCCVTESDSDIDTHIPADLNSNVLTELVRDAQGDGGGCGAMKVRIQFNNIQNIGLDEQKA